MKEEKIVLRTKCGCRRIVEIETMMCNSVKIQLMQLSTCYIKEPLPTCYIKEPLPEFKNRTFTYYGQREFYYEGLKSNELRVFEEE